MSFLTYHHSSPPHNNRSLVTSPQSNRVTDTESNSRLTLPVPRCPAGSLPFPADGHSLAPKIPDLASALYGLPYGNHAVAPSLYTNLPSGVDPTALYAALSRMDPKDIPTNWRGLYPQLGAYDPALASLFYGGGFPPMMLADRVPPRKNATRETTATLKSWLNEHRKNPYPTKGEKIMLAMVSKMTLTQVSTWFANARRRLKKENKMTWSPRNRCSEDRDSDDENRDVPISAHHKLDDMNNRRASPHKDDDASPCESERSENHVMPNGIPLQHYHQQMVIRQLASLSPHLRTPEAIKSYQEQMQLCSRWGSSRTADTVSPASLAAFNQSRPFIPGLLDSQSSAISIAQQRKTSLSSPSSSSYDRTPSPLHRDAVRLPSLSEQSKPSSNNQEEKEPNKKIESASNSKPAIWSPVNIAVDKTAEKKSSSPLSFAQHHRSFGNPHSSVIVPEKKNRLSPDSTGSRISSQSDKFNSSQSPIATTPKMWAKEHTSHESLAIYQQALAATLASLSGRKSDPMSHSHLVEKFHRNSLFNSPSAIPQDHAEKGNGGSEKFSSSPSSGEIAEHLSDQDANTPMNLSKHTKQEEDDCSLMNMKMEHETRTASIVAN